MQQPYDHQEIEKKWRKRWQELNLDEVRVTNSDNKFYCLDMFPYPSGEGLHVGHWRGYILSDYFARYNRLLGKNVLHPIGFDAFGLPAENAAIKNKSHPKVFTDAAINHFSKQLQQMGAAYDWSKTINTSAPQYYRWTQWLFLQLMKQGYAEKRLSWVNWCPKDQTVLANEQVISGKCERCGSTVTKKQLSQWFFLITKLAQELLDGLDALDWPENVKTLQRNWIGRSEGVIVTFHSDKVSINVFTTRPDTIYGVNAIILAPEHPEVIDLTRPEHKESVLQYMEETKRKSDVDRQQEAITSRTGVFTGSYALHPLTHRELPIWVADYVLPHYGSGAIMSVPAHDQRDHDFSRSHNLPSKQVIDTDQPLPYSGQGKVINSDRYDGLASDEAGRLITQDLQRQGLGNSAVQYRLRDWLVSRQRYWGPPIPVVYDPEGRPHPVNDKDLPIILPEDVDFKPGGESPIKQSVTHKKRAESLYGKGWQFETDTIDTFVDSSWYYLRYLSPEDSKQAFNPELVAKWLPVDLYIGGIEHAILHLLYARFIYRFLVKYSYVKTDNPEPFQKLFNIGMVGLHGAKMSKSKGNVVSPDPLVEHYGTDALRGYELFLGPMENSLEWNPRGINGIHRFLLKLWQQRSKVGPIDSPKQEQAFDSYLEDINSMLEEFRLNTVISAAMIFMHKIEADTKISGEVWKRYLITLAPAFPFLAEDLWQQAGNAETIFRDKWPQAFKGRISKLSIKVLIDQRFIGEIAPTKDPEENELISLIKSSPEYSQKLLNRQIIRSVYKRGELINLVTEPVVK